MVYFVEFVQCLFDCFVFGVCVVEYVVVGGVCVELVECLFVCGDYFWVEGYVYVIVGVEQDGFVFVVQCYGG